MWAQVLRVILANPIIFIVSSAVLFTLGAKVDLARITIPPTRPVSPSPIIALAPLSNGFPPEESLPDLLLQDSGSRESCCFATIQDESDLNEQQQGQDSSSEASYSWPETLPVAEEPWNEDSIALQGQSQPEINGEFEDPTITLSSVSPSTTGVARTGYFRLISYASEYFFGFGGLDRSKPESKSDAPSSTEDPPQSPVAPIWDDFDGRPPSLNDLWRVALFSFGLFLGLCIVPLKVKYGRKLVVEIRFSLLESRHKLLVEDHKAATEKLKKEGETNETLNKTNEALKKRNEALNKGSEALYKRNQQAYQELVKRDKQLDRLEKISGVSRSTSEQELDEDMERLKEDVATLSAQNKDLRTRLFRESGKNAELKRRFDSTNATVEREVREANEAKFQAIAEASEARKEAEASRRAAETARLELDAKFKEAGNEKSIAIAQAEAVISENASLKKALAESEENTANVQKEAYAALANMESQLNAEKLVKENLARDYERALALKTEANAEATPAGVEFSENSSVPIQPFGEAAVPTTVAEPQSSPAEDGLIPSSTPAPTTNTSDQSWLKPLGFTMEVHRATSFPKSEPGLFGISFGMESTGLVQQEFDAVASCGGTDNSKSDSMEASNSTPSSTNGSSIFGTGPATLSTPFNVPVLLPTTAPLEGPAAISQQLGAPALQPGSSQDMGAPLSYGGWNDSSLDSMEVEASAPQASSMASTFGFNAAAVNPPTEVDAIFDASIAAAFGNLVPISQQVAGEPESTAIFDSIMTIMEATPLPPPSQSVSSTGFSSAMSQQWGTLQPLPNPGFGISPGQEPTFVPNAVPMVPMDNVAVQPLGNEGVTPHENQNLLFNWIFGSFTNVAPNPNDPFGSSQVLNSNPIPPTGAQLGSIVAEPNSLVVPLTLYPPTQPSPAATSPPSFDQAQGTGYITGSSPFAPNPNPFYIPTPPPSSLNSLVAPLFVPPFDQTLGIAPINLSHTADPTVPFSAPVAENSYTQSFNTGAANDDEASSESEDFEDVLASIVNPGTGDVIIPLSPRPIPASDRLPSSSDALMASMEENTGSSGQATRGVSFGGRRQNEDQEDEDEDEVEDNFPPAAYIPRLERAILPLPRSLRRAQGNGTREFFTEGAVQREATADEGDSSDAWGAADNDQRPSTPPTTENGERTIRPLPRSRRRARAPVADQDANTREQARLPEQDEGAWRTSSPLPTSPEGGSALHPSFGEYYRPPPVEEPDPEGPVWDSDPED
ncbi:hypothetical protein FS837_001777 [Tulasnella sp. UAMH 9824]|nr:hypothetical protein FS837_001777 [Tulasnella sp. UAMH 9824]